jgi:hypothetical protein
VLLMHEPNKKAKRQPNGNKVSPLSVKGTWELTSRSIGSHVEGIQPSHPASSSIHLAHIKRPGLFGAF